LKKRRQRRIGPGHRPATSSISRTAARCTSAATPVEKLLARGGFFWLDLDQPVAADFEILRQVFGFHPLAVEDSEHFDQRAKIDEYEDFVFIVVYGAAPDDDPTG
jgi:Mg2+ and Co2+ transporter CorA